MEASKETDLQSIVTHIMKIYNDKIFDYLEEKKGVITDADVIVMIMNLSVASSINIYYSMKQIIPGAPLDFDYMRAKMINAISDGFEKIKDYTPQKSMIQLTAQQVKEIYEQGFTIIKLDDGSEKRATKDDILISKDELEKLIEHEKRQQNTPKIIAPAEKKIFHRPEKG